MPIPPHPLRTYREERSLTLDHLVSLLADVGRKTSADYLRLIELGHSRPSFPFAEDIETATRGKVLAIDVLRYERPDAGTDRNGTDG